MAAPTSMTWLTMQEAAKYGIDVRPIPNESATPPPPSPAPAPQRGIAAASPSWEQRTLNFISANFVAWSALALLDVNAVFGPFYAERVMYYGRTFTKTQVIADKARFIQQWPRRKYTPRATDMDVHCNGSTCSVSGMVDWETFNASTPAHAWGSARYEYSVNWYASGPRILLETSAVITRERQ
jgi:hypothetical protein